MEWVSVEDRLPEPDKTYINHQPPGEERANIRSKTPEGFARAVFQHNHRRQNGAA